MSTKAKVKRNSDHERIIIITICVFYVEFFIYIFVNTLDIIWEYSEK